MWAAVRGSARHIKVRLVYVTVVTLQHLHCKFEHAIGWILPANTLRGFVYCACCASAIVSAIAMTIVIVLDSVISLAIAFAIASVIAAMALSGVVMPARLATRRVLVLAFCQSFGGLSPKLRSCMVGLPTIVLCDPWMSHLMYAKAVQRLNQ